MNKHYYIDIMTNKNNTVLYTGVTNDIKRRVFEHKERLVDGVTKRYDIDKLVYFEIAEDPIAAISREKQIKGGSRRKKRDLVHGMNPHWNDLHEGL